MALKDFIQTTYRNNIEQDIKNSQIFLNNYENYQSPKKNDIITLLSGLRLFDKDQIPYLSGYGIYIIQNDQQVILKIGIATKQSLSTRLHQYNCIGDNGTQLKFLTESSVTNKITISTHTKFTHKLKNRTKNEHYRSFCPIPSISIIYIDDEKTCKTLEKQLIELIQPTYN